MPDSISTFEFLFITALIGFILVFFIFFNELFRIDLRHIRQCLVLAIQSFVFNVFLVLGSKDIDSTTVSSVISSYFVFIPLLEFILYKTLPKINIIIAIAMVCIGIPLIVGLNVENFHNKRIMFLILADLTIALNIVTIGNFARGSNPAILAMGQLFFTTIISFVCWCIESKINNVVMIVPTEPMFWGSAIFISFFIRGLYTIVQVYAQRYVTPVNAALIFSSEIIMTLLLSGFVYNFVFNEPYDEKITIPKVIGVIFMLMGILTSEIDFTSICANKNKG